MRCTAVAIGLALALSLSGQAGADERACSSYFSQDLRNKLVVINNTTGKQVSISSLCSSENSSSTGGFSASYAGVGIGANEASTLAKAMCDNKFGSIELSSQNSVYQSVIDPSVIQAARECFALSAKGLHYDVHADADTHVVTISMSYNGPNAISIKDIQIYGNAQCSGSLFVDWTEKKSLTLDSKSQALVCSPKQDDAVAGSSADITPGSIVVVTDAGPIHAQIPRRFAPTLESQFRTLQEVADRLSRVQAEHQKLLAKRVVAAMNLKDGKIISISEGASFTIEGNTGTLTFSNPANKSFVPVLTTFPDTNVSYSTRACYIRSLTATSVVFSEGAKDTGSRIFPPTNCTIIVVSNDLSY